MEPAITQTQAEAFTFFFSGKEFTKASVDELPTEIAGQPVEYLWKDAISTGEYTHPIEKWKLNVTPDRLDHWKKTGDDMLAAGLDIPINCDHSDAARDCVGYIKDFKVENGKLMTLCQFIGKDAGLLAARNRVSVMVKGSYVDGQNRTWNDAIAHLALTPIPVVGNQSPFKQAAYMFSLDLPIPEIEEGVTEPIQEEPIMDEMCSMKCSKETMDGLHKCIPGLSDAGDDDKAARVLQHLHSMAKVDEEDADMDPTMMASLSSDKIHEKAKENRKNWKKNQIVPIAAEVKEAVSETFSTKLDVAFSRGAIDRPTKEKLAALLDVNETANTFAFSKVAGKKSLALSLIEILAENKPIEVKEMSGVQILSRDSQKSAKLEEMNTFALRQAGVPTKTKE